MPERAKKTRCGGVAKKNLRGGYDEEGKEDEMQWGFGFAGNFFFGGGGG